MRCKREAGEAARWSAYGGGSFGLDQSRDNGAWRCCGAEDGLGSPVVGLGLGDGGGVGDGADEPG